MHLGGFNPPLRDMLTRCVERIVLRGDEVTLGLVVVPGYNFYLSDTTWKGEAGSPALFFKLA